MKTAAIDSAKVARTKHILASKLMEMLEKKPLKKILIKDICQSTHLSRAVFYLHFEDKYHLLRYCFEVETRRWAIETEDKPLEEFLSYILDAILEKRDFYQHVLIDHPGSEQVGILRSVFTELLTARLKKKVEGGGDLPGPISFVSAFCAGGILNQICIGYKTVS